MHPNPPPLTLQLDPTCSDPHKPFGTYTRHAAFQVCNRYLESNSSDTLSAHQATRLLYQMIPETKPHKSQSHSHPARDLCTELISIARQIPYTHPPQAKLVKLVSYLARCDRFNNPVDSGGYTIYESMSGLYAELYQTRYGTSPDHLSTVEFTKLLNLCAFQARLASAGLGSNREGMVWCMKNALEMCLPGNSSSKTVVLFVRRRCGFCLPGSISLMRWW